jgi:hypothetical protein
MGTSLIRNSAPLEPDSRSLQTHPGAKEKALDDAPASVSSVQGLGLRVEGLVVRV